jgi:hypothetical protein
VTSVANGTAQITFDDGLGNYATAGVTVQAGGIRQARRARLAGRR